MDKKTLFVIALLLGAFLIAAWLRGAFTTRMAPTGVTVKVGKNQYVVTVAGTLASQAQGLSGRQSLAVGEGMLFIFPVAKVQTFWMHGMLFPIDIVWMHHNQVVGFVERAPVPTGQSTPTFSSPELADLVLELPAGTVAKDQIRRGDSVVISGYTRE